MLASLNLKVRAPRIDLQKHENFTGKFHQNFEGRKSNWEKDGLNNFMIVLLFLWLCLRLKPTRALKDGTSNGVVINSGLAILPEHIWTATRDVKYRKHNYAPNYRYGLNL